MTELAFLLRENVGVVLLMSGLTLAFVAGGAWMSGLGSAPVSEEGGEVVRFGHYENKGAAGPLVLVRTADGRLQGLLATPESLAGCRTGSRIRLVRHGTVLSVALPGCVASSSRP